MALNAKNPWLLGWYQKSRENTGTGIFTPYLCFNLFYAGFLHMGYRQLAGAGWSRLGAGWCLGQ